MRQAGRARDGRQCARDATADARVLNTRCAIVKSTMADWSLMEHDWLQAPPAMPSDPHYFGEYDPYYRQKQALPVPHLPPQAQRSTLTLLASSEQPPIMTLPPQPLPPDALPLPLPSSLPLPLPSSLPLPLPPALPLPLPPALPLPLPVTSTSSWLCQPAQAKVTELEEPEEMEVDDVNVVKNNEEVIMPETMDIEEIDPTPQDNPREMRNKAEKQRRDKLNQSIAELAAVVPPVVYSSRKIDKTGVLRYTAHYLRAHQYVFDPREHSTKFTPSSTQALLALLNGFLLTTTYKGLIVVVSQNINEYLGYTELELLGRSVFGIVHEEDRQLLQEQLMPKTPTLGNSGEVVVPEEEDARQKVAQALANEKRKFVVRFMKLGQRSQPSKYVTCHVEGSLRMSDRACRGHNRCCQVVRRARARGDNPCSSGNDVVFIGVVRPATETFINESALESYKMEYRTRHSIDGEIIQSEQRIALVTGYMTSEVNGVNAMNFIHRDEVRWVIIALREMYKQNKLFGESCYRLMTKDGQFIYMRTRGRLDVDSTRAVTSFVCTNTVIEEEEGKKLIKKMKDQFTMQVNNKDTQAIEDVKDRNYSQTVPVEDPRQLEKVILKLVTNLPSPQTNDNMTRNALPVGGASSSRTFSIIPPKKERIVSAIEKIYTVIKTIPKQPSILQEEYLPNETKDASVATPLDTAVPAMAPCSPATSVDFEYATEFNMDSAFDEMASLDFEDNGTLPTMWFYKNSDLEAQGSNTAGVKRPGSDDQEATNKKQMINGDQVVTSSASRDHESTSMDTLYDSAVTYPILEIAMSSIDRGDHLNAEKFLLSDEVQDYFRKLDGNSD